MNPPCLFFLVGLVFIGLQWWWLAAIVLALSVLMWDV